jgi:protein-tyrosine phosphatase
MNTIDEFRQVNELLPGMFLTSCYGLADAVRARPIDLCVCVAKEHVNDLDLDPIKRTCRRVCDWPLDDTPAQDLLGGNNILMSLVALILDTLHANKNVVIFCHLGVSRSVAVCCACLMRELNIGVDAALKLVHLKRPFAQPNSGFMRQLKELERQVITQKRV